MSRTSDHSPPQPSPDVATADRHSDGTVQTAASGDPTDPVPWSCNSGSSPPFARSATRLRARPLPAPVTPRATIPATGRHSPARPTGHRPGSRRDNASPASPRSRGHLPAARTPPAAAPVVRLPALPTRHSPAGPPAAGGTRPGPDACRRPNRRRTSAAPRPIAVDRETGRETAAVLHCCPPTPVATARPPVLRAQAFVRPAGPPADRPASPPPTSRPAPARPDCDPVESSVVPNRPPVSGRRRTPPRTAGRPDAGPPAADAAPGSARVCSPDPAVAACRRRSRGVGNRPGSETAAN